MKNKTPLIIIMSIVLVIAGYFYMKNQQKISGYNAIRTADLSMIKSSLEMYYADNAAYPNALRELEESSIFPTPVDPITKKEYDYKVSEDGEYFCLSSHFEGKKGEERMKNDGGKNPDKYEMGGGPHGSNGCENL